MLRKMGVCALLLSSTACFTVSYRTHQQQQAIAHEENAAFFLWGLVGDKTVALDAICPEGPAMWNDQETFLDGFLATLTLGIYVPRTVTVYCALPGGMAPPAAPSVPPSGSPTSLSHLPVGGSHS